MKLQINSNPVNVFWSILFLISNIFILAGIYYYNEDKQSVIFILCTLTYIGICLVSLAELAITIESKYTIQLWLFGSIINIIIISIILLIKGVTLLVNKINTSIENRFQKSNEKINESHSVLIKPLWKKIILKILKIK